MKRTVIGLVLSAVATLSGASLANAAASPSSDFGGDISGGRTGGTITRYNRSVGVTGFVRDDPAPGSTTVIFVFRQGTTVFDEQTRTVSDGQRNFGWTEAGPVGGFSLVDIHLSHAGGTRIFIASVPRKA
ncbi:hypothetical protein [Amycolatopsis jiangsuensis]|uniref:Secreted protein n=1 Tax=Amycolatopsis jiangsuensis TaxID=1181879 RepID=A0A840J6R7_9PSEU|nr:hypothetical protein [Amycolatopsis jiangsuensis]MBB4689483.1 hypothetical protein [Amycolatopsis jiangsuensis]